MKVVLQRVSQASVDVVNELGDLDPTFDLQQIGPGFLLLVGVTEPIPTFSTCFGAPFMPRRPEVYGKLLQGKIAEAGANCWLVNTGWTGGAFGTGKRMPIRATRALLTAALDGSLNRVEFRKDPNFGFEVPVSVPGVDAKLLDSPQARYATLERMVRDRVITAAVQKMHLSASDMRLASALKEIPAIASLRRADGSLDVEAYKALVGAQGLTPEGFEANVRYELSAAQVLGGVMQSSFGTESQYRQDRKSVV